MTVADDNGAGTVTQDVTITVTGTNDAPVITPVDVAETLAEAETALTTLGLVRGA